MMPIWLMVSLLVAAAWIVGGCVFWALCAFGGKADDHYRHLHLVPPLDREEIWADEFRPFKTNGDDDDVAS